MVALIPNGTAYYYASDNQQFTTTRAIQESDSDQYQYCNDQVDFEGYNLAAKNGTSISSADNPPWRPIKGLGLDAHHQ